MSLNNLENKMATLGDTRNGFSETAQQKSSSKYHLLSKVRLYLSKPLCGDSGAGPRAPTYPTKRSVAYNLISTMSQALLMLPVYRRLLWKPGTDSV